jgi:hypothetical protein
MGSGTLWIKLLCREVQEEIDRGGWLVISVKGAGCLVRYRERRPGDKHIAGQSRCCDKHRRQRHGWFSSWLQTVAAGRAGQETIRLICMSGSGSVFAGTHVWIALHLDIRERTGRSTGQVSRLLHEH